MKIRALKTTTLNHNGELIDCEYKLQYISGGVWKPIPIEEEIIHLKKPKKKWYSL